MLDETIHHSTPAYTHDMGAAVIDPLIVGLSEQQEFAFVFDTRICATDSEFDVDIYAIPGEVELERALSMLEVDRAEEAETIAEFALGDIEANPKQISDPDAVTDPGPEKSDSVAGEQNNSGMSNRK